MCWDFSNVFSPRGKLGLWAGHIEEMDGLSIELMAWIHSEAIFLSYGIETS